MSEVTINNISEEDRRMTREGISHEAKIVTAPFFC
jgi:hypothetical protein